MGSRSAPRARRLLFVTGGSGFLGREVLRIAGEHGWTLLAPSSGTLDVRRRDRVLDEVRAWRPGAVLHLAYRRDDRATIVDGSRNVAEAAARVGARLVHLSTDLVFGGRARPYTEADRPDPVIDYGRDKLAAEHAVLEACPGAVLVRTSLLYGRIDRSPVQLDVRRALTGERPMTFFSDEVRCPTAADDLAPVLLALAGRRDVTGPLHVAGSEAVSRAEFARRTARELGLDPALVRTSSIAESGQVRPARVVLDSSRAAALGLAPGAVATRRLRRRSS